MVNPDIFAFQIGMPGSAQSICELYLDLGITFLRNMRKRMTKVPDHECGQ